MFPASLGWLQHLEFGDTDLPEFLQLRGPSDFLILLNSAGTSALSSSAPQLC